MSRVCYGHFAFSATFTDEAGVQYGHMFLAESWKEAEAIAARLRLTNVGKLKGIYPAGRKVTDWAQQKGTAQ